MPIGNKAGGKKLVEEMVLPHQMKGGLKDANDCGRV
jgi:hypothetical protein